MTGTAREITSPDLAEFYRILAAIDPAVHHRARWRIPADDWAWLRDNAPRTRPGMLVPPIDSAGKWHLFGAPVEVVTDGTVEWPQLVIDNDRRNHRIPA